MFVSPRFQDVFGSGPFGSRLRDRPAAAEQTDSVAGERDNQKTHGEAGRFDFTPAHVKAAWAFVAEFVPAPVSKAEFIPAPVFTPEFIPVAELASDG